MFRQGLRGDGRWVFGNRIVRRKDGGRAGAGGLAVVESGLWELGELWLPCGLWHVEFAVDSFDCRARCTSVCTRAIPLSTASLWCRMPFYCRVWD